MANAIWLAVYIIGLLAQIAACGVGIYAFTSCGIDIDMSFGNDGCAEPRRSVLAWGAFGIAAAAVSLVATLLVLSLIMDWMSRRGTGTSERYMFWKKVTIYISLALYSGLAIAYFALMGTAAGRGDTDFTQITAVAVICAIAGASLLAIMLVDILKLRDIRRQRKRAEAVIARLEPYPNEA
ncbi:hypothetical protein B0I35DRAFT_438019 [Stachybotrys elegans]|uniref:MARVEL domain-containing protein n=1 Tax=Stachybotrys elegans TaxID=80388 RepID=A0A8K0SPH1_9HYPO|nr:hypothetical protein B0I35DRAFT_438019 [Stachybotrys elegans]